MNIIQSPSVNFSSRYGYVPELLVIHCTDGLWPTDKEWLCNSESEVSAHFIISPAGEVHQLVSIEDAAWHAGRVNKPTAKLLKKNTSDVYVNPNKYTIGIEVSLKLLKKMTKIQKDILPELIKMITKQCNIPIDRDHIIGHKEIYNLKTCPGTISVDELVLTLAPVNFTNSELKVKIIELLNKIQ